MRGQSVGRRYLPKKGRAASPSASSGAGDTASSTSNVDVPNLIRDPIWSLKPWPMDIILGPHHVIHLDALPAVEWLTYLLSTEPDIISLVSDLMPELEDYVFDNELSGTEFFELALWIIGEVSGRDWWVAIRLILFAARQWHIMGPAMLLNGADPSKISLAMWLDIALVTALENIKPEKATMFTLDLEVKPILPGQEEPATTPSELPMPIDKAAFLAFAR